MVFHHIVGSTVLLEDIVYIDDVGVTVFGDHLSLLNELRLEPLDKFTATDRRHTYMGSLRITVAMFLHEELLDRHLAVKAGLDGHIGYSEAALTEQFLYPVSAALKDGAVFQMHDDFGLSIELHPKGNILLTAKQTAHAYCTKWWDFRMK